MILQRRDGNATCVDGTPPARSRRPGRAGYRRRDLALRGTWVARDSGSSNIDHAITIVVNCDNGTAVYPADTPNGQHCSNPTGAPPLGARFRLNMTWAQIDALPAPAWKKTVLKAMSKYGAFMDDTGTSFYFDWQTESGNQYTSQGAADPWLAFGAANWEPSSENGGYTGTWHDNDDGISWRTQVWANLQVVDSCVSDGSC